jgi:hypothetical protein
LRPAGRPSAGRALVPARHQPGNLSGLRMVAGRAPVVQGPARYEAPLARDRLT